MLSGTSETHDWQPLSGWSGRYRCETCRILGYRGIVNAAQQEGRNHNDEPIKNQPRVRTIIPYICKVRDCKRGAVVRKPKQLCIKHRGGSDD